MLKRSSIIFVILALMMVILLPSNIISVDAITTNKIYKVSRQLETYKKGINTGNSYPYDIVNIIEIKVNADDITADEEGAILSFKFPKEVMAEVKISDYTSSPNAIQGIMVTDAQSGPSNSYDFYMNINANEEDAHFYIYIYNMTIPEDYNDFQITASFESKNSNIFPKDEMAIAYVEGGHLTVEVEEESYITTFNKDNYIPPITFAENFTKAITDIELTLPDGFYWDNTVKKGLVIPREGFYSNQEQEVYFTYSGSVRGIPEASPKVTIPFSLLKEIRSDVKSSWELLSGGLKIIVDSTEAKLGGVEGKGNRITPATFTIATYGHQTGEAVEVTTARLLSGRTQPLGEFKVTEKKAGALEKGRTIILTLPEGLKWISYPTISETSETNGLTLAMEQGKTKWEKVDEDGRSIRTTISKESSETAGILIFEGGEVNIDEDYEGSAEMIVCGNAGATGVVPLGNVQYLPGSKVGELSPSPGEIPMQTAGKTVVFTINQPIYKIDNQVKNALLTPYIKDGRTFLGLKDVAIAVGVKEEDIIWDDTTQTVTLQKNGRIIQLQLGSNIIRSNDTVVLMNTVAESKNARTTLPVAYIMQALDVPYVWDGNNNTVTITLKE